MACSRRELTQHRCSSIFLVTHAQITKELGMTLTPIEETWVDMATTMIALGVAKPVSK